VFSAERHVDITETLQSLLQFTPNLSLVASFDLLDLDVEITHVQP
jgi:hypothetical protein